MTDPNEVELYCKDYVEVAEAYGCLGVLCMNQGRLAVSLRSKYLGILND